jgi:hypothetical protein
MRWFRFYDDVLNDPKVQRLDPQTFKNWVNVLCLASKNGGVLPPPADIGFLLRMSTQDAEEMIGELRWADLLDKTDAGLVPHNWDARQYRSDNSTERVKRFRNSKRNVSETFHETKVKRRETVGVKQNETVTETGPDTDTDTDTDSTPLPPSPANEQIRILVGGEPSMVSRPDAVRLLRDGARLIDLPIDHIDGLEWAPKEDLENLWMRLDHLTYGDAQPQPYC